MEFDEQLMHLAHPSPGEAGEPRTSALSTGSVAAGLIVPVILSGGGGSRLWPVSTNETPKQFLRLVDETTLFERALDRVHDRRQFSPPVVVGGIRHAEHCERHLADEGETARLVLEPCARNTAAAVVMAAEVVSEIYGDDALMLVMPSDHIIEDVSAFHGAINKGATAARMGRLVTFGIRPAGPDTGYGYLEMGSEIADSPSVCDVAKFVEKPASELAEAMVQSGNHLWNAGIFLFRADVLLEEAMSKAPLITGSARAAVAAGKRDGIRIIPDALILSECPSESIDYAIMEHSERIAVVPMSPGWSDLGSWDALATLIGTDALIGPITAVDCENCYIRSDGLQVAALGVRDLIIVASGERLLIVPRGRSQEVKKLFSVIDPIAA